MGEERGEQAALHRRQQAKCNPWWGQGCWAQSREARALHGSVIGAGQEPGLERGSPCAAARPQEFPVPSPLRGLSSHESPQAAREEGRSGHPAPKEELRAAVSGAT